MSGAGSPHELPSHPVPAINSLPPELLAEIFDWTITDDDAHSSFAPVLTSHVCSLWRRTATTTPRLWRDISVKIPSATVLATTSRVRACLDRAGSYPVHISLTIQEWSDEHLLQDLRDHTSHWGSLTLSTASHSLARQTLVFFLPCRQPLMLSKFDLNACNQAPIAQIFDGEMPETQDEVVAMSEDITRSLFALQGIVRRTSCFTELTLSSAVLPYEPWCQATRPRLPHLKTLRIYDCQFGRMDAASVLRFLTQCPTIETFDFIGCHVFEPQNDVIHTVTLPKLRELHLAQTFHQRSILSRLCTPKLEVLRLSSLNRPDILLADVYEPSEALGLPVDYSQSPHTDILTGRGLRTLIRESSPPLRILDLDFADARSPDDFLWLFAHLPLLETFRMVGSDMSDKVLMGLASPSSCSGSWLSPRLKFVEFSRCDFITGRGILALAKGRNPTIDGQKQESSNTPARLVKFTVEACASVDCESVALKQYIMGDVTFEVETVPPWLIFPEEGIPLL